MKIVLNDSGCNFQLSKAGVLRYAELKGLTLYSETSRGSTVFYTVPKAEYYAQHTLDTASKDWSKSIALCFEIDGNVERHDPLLVQVVEELGRKASGKYAQLKIVEVPDGIDYFVYWTESGELAIETGHSWS